MLNDLAKHDSANSYKNDEHNLSFSDNKICKLWIKITGLCRLEPLKLKLFDEMPISCRERHISGGYRPNPSSIFYCMRSVLHPTNETMNFWTHFVPMLLLMFRHHKLRQSLDWSSGKVWAMSLPFWTYCVGCYILLWCSAFAHLFNCVSARVRHLCFCCDYGAITIYSVGGTIAYFYLVAPPQCHGFNPDYANLYVPFATALSIASHIACCYTRFPHVKSRYLLRTLAYLLPFVVLSFPAFIRLLVCVTPKTGSDVIVFDGTKNPVTQADIKCSELPDENGSFTLIREILSGHSHCNLGNDSFLLYYPLHLLFFILAAVFNVSRFPEKSFSGRFDVIGSSHQLFHIAIALGIISQSVIVEDALLDAINRPGVLESSAWLATISVGSTMGWLCTVTFASCIVVAMYGRVLPIHTQ